VEIGIDGGGTLLKIAWKEDGAYRYKIIPSDRMDECAAWVGQFENPRITLTGGRSQVLAAKLPYPSTTVHEFTTTVIGARHFLREELGFSSEPFVLASVGTGTSIYHATETTSERVGGTGVGGGLFLRLASLLTGEKDFARLTEMAQEGVRTRVDMTVGDIYGDEPCPIPLDLTASNFGKVASTDPRDLAAAVAGLVGESVANVCCQAAKRFGTRRIVYIGSTLSNNPAVRKALISTTTLYGEQPHFLERGPFCGAMGALLSGQEA
jgi:type II pantothenate kinase